ncbi:ubiquitin carboxyl-terminal [Brachionus plicatilis]|uniref:Ubiquitin carboxyl-terminal n=1 Tax=Brachionus plicatilis TaxID=10195 RepID=A0A3M7QTZ2_BRAPC|nr:ubiquitin carboxyl-terminal [Brachionus plicatilis]
MDDLVITLPCGFTSKYKEIFDKEGKFPCPACMSHMISAQCCVNMTKNKLVINQTRLDLKRQDMSERVKTLEDYKTDPSFYIDEYYSELRNQIDLRREEIKLTMNKKIDDYYENLLETINKQRESKLNEFRENIGKMSAYKVDDFKILNNLHVNSQLDSINETIKNLDEKINFIDKTIAILTENSLVLNKSKVNWDIGKIFGELETRKEVNYFQNNGILVEIKNQTEATFQLLIDDFSQFKQGKIIDIHSKQFRVQNFLWFIRARSIQQNNGQMDLEFCLQCLSVNDKSDELSANVNAELRLLHTSDYDKNLVFQIGNFLKYKNKFASYSQLITLDELDDPAKGFYNILNDSITLEVWSHGNKVF